MYIRNKGSAIQKVTINIGSILGQDKDDETYITLKEMSTMETMRLKEAQEKGESEMLLCFQSILPCIIVDHNLFEDEDKKMTNQGVASFIYEKLNLSLKIVMDYINAVFHSPANGTEDR